MADDETIEIPAPEKVENGAAADGAQQSGDATAIKAEEPEASASASAAAAAVAEASSSPSTKHARPVKKEEEQEEAQKKRAEEPAAKRPRRDAEARNRGRRLFGLVTSTLKKNANENEKLKTGEAGKRRSEIEERQKLKLQQQADQLRSKAVQAREEKMDLAELMRLNNAIALGEADFRVRKAQKRRLASFLCVKTDVRDSTLFGGRSRGYQEPLSTADYATELPFALEPLREGALYPTYYLPAKLLSSQEDELDEQEDRVDRLIDDAETEWRERRANLEKWAKEIRDRIRSRRQEAAGDNPRGTHQHAAGQAHKGKEEAAAAGDASNSKADAMDTEQEAVEPIKDVEMHPAAEAEAAAA
ncbi:hypothetical protein V8E36_004355 [Tilletia maclaganii]